MTDSGGHPAHDGGVGRTARRSPGCPATPRAEHPADRLLEESWSKRERKPAHREVVVEARGRGAVPGRRGPAGPARAGIAPARRRPRGAAAGALCARGRRDRLPDRSGLPRTRPTCVLVPMLLLLPPAIVPLLAAVGGVVASLGRLASGRARPGNVLFAIPNAWYAMGPAVVLMVAGTHHGEAGDGRHLPGGVSGRIHDRPAHLHAPRGGGPDDRSQIQLRVTAQVWLLDACVAPLGLLLALAARHDHAALLIVLPLGTLLLHAPARPRSADRPGS